MVGTPHVRGAGTDIKKTILTILPLLGSLSTPKLEGQFNPSKKNSFEKKQQPNQKIKKRTLSPLKHGPGLKCTIHINLHQHK
jgi:hypothetical protein